MQELFKMLEIELEKILDELSKEERFEVLSIKPYSKTLKYSPDLKIIQYQGISVTIKKKDEEYFFDFVVIEEGTDVWKCFLDREAFLNTYGHDEKREEKHREYIAFLNEKIKQHPRFKALVSSYLDYLPFLELGIVEGIIEKLKTDGSITDEKAEELLKEFRQTLREKIKRILYS